MSAEKKKQAGVLGLIVALVVVLFGGVLFVGAASGWFDDAKVVLDVEYICGENCNGELMDLDAAGYEKLIQEKKSFVVMVDQGDCTTADKLRGFVLDYAKEAGIKIYRIMFSEMKETSLHEKVKYYPSLVVISKGKVVEALRADADEDAGAYNNYEELKNWLGRYL